MLFSISLNDRFHEFSAIQLQYMSKCLQLKTHIPNLHTRYLFAPSLSAKKKMLVLIRNRN